MLHKPHTEQSGHATLVYCKTKDDEIGVLGGNQGDSVMINPLKEVYIKNKNLNLLGIMSLRVMRIGLKLYLVMVVICLLFITILRM